MYLFEHGVADTLKYLYLSVKRLRITKKSELAVLQRFPPSLLGIDISKCQYVDRLTLLALVTRATKYSRLEVLKVCAQSLYDSANEKDGWEEIYLALKDLCDWLVKRGKTDLQVQWVNRPEGVLVPFEM